MSSEDEEWSQTQITITPEENATLREITSSTILSAGQDTLLDVETEDIVFRQSLGYYASSDFIDPMYVEESRRDAENQTYLQGVPDVDVSTEYRDVASQTMYMSKPCPPLKYFKDIMTSMNDVPMPELKTTNIAETVINIHPNISPQEEAEYFSLNISDKELADFVPRISPEEEATMEAVDVLHFLLGRAFWILDPSSQTEAEIDHKETQTSIRFNFRTNAMVADIETQTVLTCEPKKSNTNLISDYQETKNLIETCLEQCLTSIVEPRIVANDIVDEIINQCADRIRLPMNDQIAQTIASYLLHEEREENVLRSLKLELIIDPLEASIVVVPLVDDLLTLVCDVVSKDAHCVVKHILDTILRRTMLIISRLNELRKETIPEPLDKILERRRKKILQSMSKKKTESVGTQTGLAGVPEVMKYKEPKDTVCSICRERSACQWCLAGIDSKEELPQQENKILGTRDILLAYKPCYIVTRTTETQKNSILQPPCPTATSAPQFSKPQTIFTPKLSPQSSETVNVLLKPEKKIKKRDSLSGWSYIIDAALIKTWSAKESLRSSSVTSPESSRKCSLKCICSKRTSKSHSGLASPATEALQILKNTFCTQETCTANSLRGLEDNCFSGEDEHICIDSNCTACSLKNNDRVFCTPKTCEAYSKLCPLKNRRNQYNKNKISETKSRNDGFKVIPLCLLYNSDSRSSER